MFSEKLIALTGLETEISYYLESVISWKESFWDTVSDI